MRCRFFCYCFCSQHIVFYCLDRLILHQRYVLMRRRVKNYLRCKAVHNAFYSFPVTHVGDDRNFFQLRIICIQILHDFVDTVFTFAQKQHFLWLHFSYLTADLTAYGAACSGHKHDLIFEMGADSCCIESDCFSSQQVFDFDVTQLANADRAVDELVYSGKDFQLAFCSFTDLQDLLQGFTFDRGHSNNNLFYTHPDDIFLDCKPVPQHFDAEHPLTDFFLIVVDKADYVSAVVVIAFYFSGYYCSRIAGTDDEYFSKASVFRKSCNKTRLGR